MSYSNTNSDHSGSGFVLSKANHQNSKTTMNTKPIKTSLFFALLTLLFYNCSPRPSLDKQEEIYTSELLELKDLFSIPGMSAVITQGDKIIYEKYLGHADIEKKTPVDSLTVYPIASLTKLYSAVLVMKLKEQGKLSLEDPVNAYLDSSSLNDSIQIKHLLSHTSQGQIGRQFFYSSRFGLLTSVLQKASGKAFDQLMQDEIIHPLELQKTFLLKDSTGLTPHLAAPYMLEEGIAAGFIDYGYSASAGLVSNPRDLHKMIIGLDVGKLIEEHSKELMFTGISPDLPYAYGAFKQQVEGVDVIWVYGQYDCYSSLLLKVPSKNLTLSLMANNSLMSDPARLIMGDVMSSLFAISFLKNYVFEYAEMPLLETKDSLYSKEFPKEFYRKKVLAQALATSYMARFDPENLEKSKSLVEKTIEEHPNYLSYGDINLLHNLSFLKDVYFYMNLGEFNRFDKELEALGQSLLESTPNDPYLHSYMGTYYDRKGNQEKARFHFNSIVQESNFAPNWYTSEARNWLKSN
jgi:CubicO group peptidase (beta-lactamase class C family)